MDPNPPGRGIISETRINIAEIVTITIQTYMYNNLLKYIVPLTAWSNGIEVNGVGVLIDSLFVTCGHTFSQAENISFVIDGKNYTFNMQQALALEIPTQNLDGSDYDICIFKIDGIISPFTLAMEMPEIGQNLTSVSFKHFARKNQNSNANSILDSMNEEIIEIRKSIGIVTDIEKNFFLCQMNIPLEPGRSGSPIIIDNKIYGILHGGKDNGYKCLYQSSKSIIEYINSRLKQCPFVTG